MNLNRERKYSVQREKKGRDKLTILAVKILEGLFHWITTSGYHNSVKGVWVLGIQFG